MEQFTSDFNVLNQYFSNLTEGFKLTCKQLKFLNEEKKRIQDLKSIQEEIRAINILVRLKETKHIDTVSSRFTMKELETMKKDLQEQLEGYTLEETRICFEYSFWKQRYNSQISELTNVMFRLNDNKQKLVISSKSEVEMLLAIYKEKSKLEKCRIIDCEEASLKYFPEDELSQKFLKAYCDCNVETIQKLAKDYIDY